MAKKVKTRQINLIDEEGVFSTFFKRFTQGEKEFDFDSLAALRSLLSNEKARLLYVIKSQKPISIYSLAKLVGRDFKSVSQDIKLLERFGFIEMVSEHTGKRDRLRPVLVVDNLVINISI